MRPYNSGSSSLGEGGSLNPYYGQQQQHHHHHHHQQQHHSQHHVPTQRQHQQQGHRQHQQQYFNQHMQFPGIVSPNPPNVTLPPQGSFYTHQGNVSQTSYMSQRHHHTQHQYNQRQRSGAGFGDGDRPGNLSYASTGYSMAYPLPQRSHYPDKYVGGRGHGPGVTRGGNNSFFGVRESYFAVHLKDFSELEGERQRNSLSELLPVTVLGKMNRRASAGILKILIIVGRQCLAGCMSVPRSGDDIIVTKEIATQFLNVQHVYCDDGIRLVDIENGTHIAKNVYTTLRIALGQLMAYSKPPLNTVSQVDLSLPPGVLLLKDIVLNPTLFAALSRGLAGDNETAKQLWARLLLEPSTTTMTDNVDNVLQHQQMQFGKSTASGLLPSCGVGIFATVQGTLLFRRTILHPERREALFRVLRDAALPQLQTRSEEMISQCTPEQLFMALFSCSLASRFVFECFGLVEGIERCDEEVRILCAGLERLALKVMCSNGGSFVMTALVKALFPNRSQSGYKTRGKRGRGSELFSKQQQKQRDGNEGKTVDGDDDDNQKRGSSGGDDDNGNGNGTDHEMGNAYLPSSSVEGNVRAPVGPSERRLLYAVARAFVLGPIPGDTGGETVTLCQRAKLLTQHVVACRAVQSLVPSFADAVLQAELEAKQLEKRDTSPERLLFYEDCNKILSETANQGGLLANHSYGNYVLQTIIYELAQRAAAGASIQAILNRVFDALISTIFELSVQKCASNCVEKAIEVCDILPNGSTLVLRFATALFSEGPNRMAQVAMQEFGNYVIRKILDRLTIIATGGSTTATEEEVNEACGLELKYFNTLNAQFFQLRHSSYGVGLLAWVHNQRHRLSTSE